jgi:hypothetical protein
MHVLCWSTVCEMMPLVLEVESLHCSKTVTDDSSVLPVHCGQRCEQMGVGGDTGVSQAQYTEGESEQCRRVGPAGDTPCRINHARNTLALNNVFQCLVEPFQSIHFTRGSQSSPHLPCCIDECCVFWLTLRNSKSRQYWRS